ncbi:O-antigen ligase family protein [Camelimonas fluminis]|uniref:O-antigen ligase family protein n=1 Tax=Camelimonas fluminis TaxID=1576911 RepID=A0ABV7UFP1_9HYPH|nr:O-antigen ligase family protein [Camelimonas fluminis]
MSRATPLNHMPAPAPARSPGDYLERAAWVVLAAMPLALAFAVRSSAALIGVAALLALTGAVTGGRGRALVARAWAGARSLPGAFLPLFAALAAVSLLWHPFPRLGLFAMGEAFAPLVAAVILGLSLGRLQRRAVFILFASLFALACVEVLVELFTGMAWRYAVGMRPALFVLNKPVICFVVLYWPLWSLSEGMPRRGLTMGALGLLMAVAVFKSVSGAAMLALICGGLTFGLARLAPRFAWGLVMAGLFAALALAPLKGDLAQRAVPGWALDRLQALHARDRVEIWQSFGEVVLLQPFTGVGFGVSPKMGDAPVARLIPGEHRTLLAVGHPHDMFLQIWSELGALGALLAAVALAWLGKALLMLRRREELPPALAAISAVIIIAEVGHGAWQGWWLAILGAAAIWFCKSFEAVRYDTAPPSAAGDTLAS